MNTLNFVLRKVSVQFAPEKVEAIKPHENINRTRIHVTAKEELNKFGQLGQTHCFPSRSK